MSKVRAYIRVCRDGRLEAVERRPVWLTYDGRRVARYRGEWRVISDDNRLDIDLADSIVDKDDIDFSRTAARGLEPRPAEEVDTRRDSRVERGSSAEPSEKGPDDRSSSGRSSEPTLSAPRRGTYLEWYVDLLQGFGITRLADLGLSQRVTRALTRAGIDDPFRLLALTRAEVLEIERVGDSGMREILEGVGSALWRWFESENVQPRDEGQHDAREAKPAGNSIAPEYEAPEHPDQAHDKEATELKSGPRVIKVPSDIRDLSLRRVDLTERARNTLLRAGIERVGDLHGWTEDDLLSIDGIGPQRIEEIFAGLCTRSALRVSHEDLMESESGKPAATLEKAGLLAVPLSHRVIPLVDLDLTKAVRSALEEAEQIKTLGDLADHGADAAVRQLGHNVISRVREVVDAISHIPIEKLTGLSDTPAGVTQSGLLPKLRPEILELLASAESPADEIAALVADLDERNADFFLARLPLGTVERPTLESIAESAGLSRERVRQIVSKREKYLRESNLRLPISSRLVEALDAAGGLHGTHGCLQLLEEAGHGRLPPETLAALPELARLGLVPHIEYKSKYSLWLTDRGIEEWWRTGRFKKFRQSVRKQAMAGFRRISAAVLEELVPDCPIEADDILPIVTPPDTRLRKQLGHLIPVPAPDSTLTRLVDKTLAVCQEISLTSLRSGLRRWRRLGQPPPTDVLRVILASHPDFTIEGSVVRWASPKSVEEVLASSEREAVKIFEQSGGIVLLWDFVDAMEAAGFSAPTAQLTLSRPYIRHPSTAIYALRARDIPASAVRKMEGKRTESRSVSVVSANWKGPDRFEVHYLLSRYNLQGILGVPPGLKAQRESWRGRLPNGRVVELTIRNGFLWNLKSWFDAEEASAGDHIFATFLPAQAIVEFELLKE